VSPLTKKDSSLATISGKIRMVESAVVDGKTAQPNWNSLKNLRITLCLSGVRRIPLSPPASLNCREIPLALTPKFAKLAHLSRYLRFEDLQKLTDLLTGSTASALVRPLILFRRFRVVICPSPAAPNDHVPRALLNRGDRLVLVTLDKLIVVWKIQS